ncbi:MAG: DUF2155 domain-containing protein [Alphaproteobacteria bacterium]
MAGFLEGLGTNRALIMRPVLLVSALAVGLFVIVAPFAAQSQAAQSQEAAQAAPETAPAAEDDAAVPMVAVLRGLDKVTARVREYELPVGQTMRMGGLSITVRACHTRPPEEPPESTAFLEIDENRAGNTQERVFSGWMFASSPALNPLEHPVYDVWLMTCRALSPEQGDSSR